MKAYLVTDRNGSIPHAEIIFAETRGKAVNLALDTEEFDYCSSSSLLPYLMRQTMERTMTGHESMECMRQNRDI